MRWSLLLFAISATVVSCADSQLPTTTKSLVKDIAPGESSACPSAIFATGGLTYFYVRFGEGGFWITDGTDAGTLKLKSHQNDARFQRAVFGESGGRVFFLTGADNFDLWATDGTVAGTLQVKELSGRSALPEQLFSTESGLLFFVLDDDSFGARVWRSDGTPDGTFPLNVVRSVRHMVAAKDFVYFAAGDPSQLWRSEGTADETKLLADFAVTQRPTAKIKYPTYSGGTLFFFRGNESFSEFSSELWKSDGTSAGTVLVKDVGTEAFGPSIGASGGALFFEGIDAEHGRELWISNGTADGTRIVKDLNPGSQDSSFCGGIAVKGGFIFCAGNLQDYGNHKLWKTDGTADGTFVLNDLGDARAHRYFDDGDRIFFVVATDPDLELWVSDETEAGTGKIGELGSTHPEISPECAQITPFAKSDRAFFFAGTEEEHGTELWNMVVAD